MLGNAPPPGIPPGEAVTSSDDGGRRVAEQVGLDDLDVLLGDLAVDDPEAAELDLSPSAGLLRLAGGDQDVVRSGSDA